MNEIVLSIALPLLAAFLLPALARATEGLALWIGPLVLLYGTWLLAGAWTQATGTPISIHIGGFAPPVGITLHIGRLALLLALASQVAGLLLWPFRIDRDTARRQSLTLILVAACTGLALSGDLFNLYVWYELASVASFGLVASAGTPRASLASLRYLLLSGLGSVLMLIGIGLVYVHTGSLNLAQLAQLAPATLGDGTGLAAFLLMLLGLGVKAELFPLNTWVPEAYATAPVRVSAILAGLVSKLAVIVVVRLLVLIFPQPEAREVLLLLGMLGTASGELAAWRARDMRRMLAWSSIGQLGMIFIAFAIPGMAGLYAGLALALHHLLVKPGLFLLTERWGGALRDLRGAGLAFPMAGGLFVLFALSLIGVPPLPGFWVKFLLVTALVAHAEPMYIAALATFLATTVIEASYLFRVVGQLYRGDGDEPRQAIAPSGGIPTPPGLGMAGSGVIAATLLLATFTIGPLGEDLRSIAVQANDVTLYIQAAFPVEAHEAHP